MTGSGTDRPLRARALVCTLSPSSKRSSRELMARQVLDALAQRGVSGDLAAVVGNEDGAHHISAILFQALTDVGYTVPSQGVTYWNGEAMHTVDDQDLDEVPQATASATATAAANAAHVARLLRSANYPPTS
jgi:hypothetical protein